MTKNSFKFNNIHYTSIYVNSNGGATFGNVNSTASSLISSISSYSGAIAVMNRDLWGVFVTGGKTTSGSNVITNVVSFEGIRTNVYIASGAGIQENTYIVGYDTAAKTITMSKNATSSFTNAAVRCGSGRILLKVDGVSPNRTFTIQWEGYNDNHTEPVGSNYLSFQLKLIEGTHQIQMVYDIGVANGKQAQITKELLIGIFITAAGSSAGSMITIQGGKILVRRASLRVIQKLVAMLGGRITQQAAKSAISKWVPIIGAGAMATWTGYMTNNIGKKADELFKLDIEDDPNTIDIEIKASR